MKKMLLLLVSSLLIVSMAGSALATGGITVKDWPDGQSYVVSVSPDGTEADLTLVFSGMSAGTTHTATVETKSKTTVTTGDTLDAVLTVPGGSSTAVAHINQGATNVVYTSPSETYECNLHINANSPGTLQVTDLATGDVFKVTCVIDTQIPEFPTVAFPVAAVIGLVFIFSRKKEGQ